MKSDALTVEEYLSQLPNDRISMVSSVRRHILTHLPEGYEETMSGGMKSSQIEISENPLNPLSSSNTSSESGSESRKNTMDGELEELRTFKLVPEEK